MKRSGYCGLLSRICRLKDCKSLIGNAALCQSAVRLPKKILGSGGVFTQRTRSRVYSKTPKPTAIDYQPMSDDASHAWHVLSRFEACVMDHNLAKATASRSPGNNIEQMLCGAVVSGPSCCAPEYSGPGEVGGDLSPAY